MVLVLVLLLLCLPGGKQVVVFCGLHLELTRQHLRWARAVVV